jgi:hypothetical protein
MVTTLVVTVGRDPCGAAVPQPNFRNLFDLTMLLCYNMPDFGQIGCMATLTSTLWPIQLTIHQVKDYCV